VRRLRRDSEGLDLEGTQVDLQCIVVHFEPLARVLHEVDLLDGVDSGREPVIWGRDTSS